VTHAAPAVVARTGSTAHLRERDVVGVSFAVTDYAGAMDAMDAMIEAGEQDYVCALAVHGTMIAREDPEMSAAVAGSSLVLPDGMPIVWAMNALGERMEDRVYGPELFRRYTARCAERGHRVWLHGGRDPETLERLMAGLRDRHAGLEIVGGYSPPHRPPRPEEEVELAERINAARPDVVWVGIRAPKQEKWMARMRPLLDAPVMGGVGAAFDFESGLVPEAPMWVQRYGLEWLYRLAREPRRLWSRYLRYNPRFAIAALRQIARQRRLVSA
jgi:N-acetylglucosaminyldiphosphoundecaprenol N-acetyl-beta-D-mannosaminyltransferase